MAVMPTGRFIARRPKLPSPPCVPTLGPTWLGCMAKPRRGATIILNTVRLPTPSGPACLKNGSPSTAAVSMPASSIYNPTPTIWPAPFPKMNTVLKLNSAPALSSSRQIPVSTIGGSTEKCGTPGPKTARDIGTPATRALLRSDQAILNPPTTPPRAPAYLLCSKQNSSVSVSWANSLPATSLPENMSKPTAPTVS